MLETLRKNEQLWDIFTRKEEYHPGVTDKYGRFSHCFSTHRQIFEPVVSRFMVEEGARFEYPGGKKFAVCLTHDIDRIYFRGSAMVEQAYKSAISGRVADAFKVPLGRIAKRWDVLWNFRETVELEEKYGGRSTFFFLTSDRDIGGVNYDIGDAREELRNIVGRGWEVGLHTGYYSYDDLGTITAEKHRLEKAISGRVRGCRNHYLRFKTPATWKLLSRAGFEYDTTFGYADAIGFRNGMCHPYKPYDLEADEEIDIVEIPLTIMDGTLFDYMRLDDGNAWTVTKALIDTVEKYHGVITILWHNTHMLGDKLKFYERILKYCSDKNAHISNCSDIVKIFREQQVV